MAAASASSSRTVAAAAAEAAARASAAPAAAAAAAQQPSQGRQRPSRGRRARPWATVYGGGSTLARDERDGDGGGRKRGGDSSGASYGMAAAGSAAAVVADANAAAATTSGNGSGATRSSIAPHYERPLASVLSDVAASAVPAPTRGYGGGSTLARGVDSGSIPTRGGVGGGRGGRVSGSGSGSGGAAAEQGAALTAVTTSYGGSDAAAPARHVSFSGGNGGAATEQGVACAAGTSAYGHGGDACSNAAEQRAARAAGAAAYGLHGGAPPSRGLGGGTTLARDGVGGGRGERGGNGRGNSGGAAAGRRTARAAMTAAYGLSGDTTPAYEGDRGGRSVGNGRGSGGGGSDAHRGGVGGSDRGGGGTAGGSAVGGNSALGVSIGADGEPSGAAVNSAPPPPSGPPPSAVQRPLPPPQPPPAPAARKEPEGLDLDRAPGTGDDPDAAAAARPQTLPASEEPRWQQLRALQGEGLAAPATFDEIAIMAWFPRERTTHLTDQQQATLDAVLVRLIKLGAFATGGGQRHVTPLVRHHIEVGNARPARAKLRRYSILELETLWKEVDKLLRKGVIEPASSPWNSPLLLVPKPDGRLRVVQDLRAVNRAVSEHGDGMDGYPLPRPAEMHQALDRAVYFTTADALDGFWQVELDAGVPPHHRVPNALGAVSVARRHHGPHAHARHLPAPHGAGHRARRAVGLRPRLHRRRLGVQPHLRRAHGAGGARVHSARSGRGGAQAV